jgi:dTDP-4-dehydrorhamnose reductase
MRILVTGASGLLGLNLSIQASASHAVTGVVHTHSLREAPFEQRQADLCATGEIERLLEEVQPDAVINCAAMAILDECEANPSRAWQINAELPGMMAAAAHRRGCQFLSISTDGVFDGQDRVYSESDQPNPLSAYARSKAAGEEAVLKANPDALLVRSNFYGWSLRGVRSLAEHFFYNLSAGRKVYGFSDVIFCPLLVNTLSSVLVEMLEKQLSGLYHVFSQGSLSKYDFGAALAQACGLDSTLIEKISISQAGLKAARSPHLEMCSAKAEAALGRSLPGPADGLTEFYSLYQQGYTQRLLAMGI